jgi:hypothetical protein
VSAYVDGAFYWIRDKDGAWRVARHDAGPAGAGSFWRLTGEGRPSPAGEFEEVGPLIGTHPPDRGVEGEDEELGRRAEERSRAAGLPWPIPGHVDLDAVPIPPRARNALMGADILTVGQTARCSDSMLLRLPGFGRLSLREVRAFIPFDPAAAEAARREGAPEGRHLDGAAIRASPAGLRSEAARLAEGVERRRSELQELTARVEGKRRELARLKRALGENDPPKPKPHERLAEALAEGRIAAERAAELLNVRPRDVPAIAAGRVGLGRWAWRRLLRELRDGGDP